MSDTQTSKLIEEIQRAAQLLRSGRRNDALLIYHDVNQQASSDVAVQVQLGNLCEEIGDIDEAIIHYVKVVEKAPDNANYLAMLGISYLNAHENEKAREVLEKAVEIDPDRYDVQYGLGFYYMRRSDYEQAVEHFERACELRPGDAQVRIQLSSALVYLNRHDDALEQSDRAIKIDKGNPSALLCKSRILSQVGDMDGATKMAEQLVRQHPKFGLAYDHLARIRKFSGKDKKLIGKAEKVLQVGMAPIQRSSLLYAVGKMHDDCGNYDKAFSHYKQANVLRSRPFAVDRDIKLRKALAKAFTASSIRSLMEHGHESRQPVFVVGMPRSGTTLTERIIASHPDGAGAGELETIASVGYGMFPESDLRWGIQHVQKELTPEIIESLAENYLGILRQGNSDASRIVDKLPLNTLFLGLIKVLFPNAAIIHSIRNPLDTCLSCYFQNFESLRWSNDLEMIGKVYTNYRKSMEYWHKVLPEGSILDMRYEELVGDTESNARRMLEHCGLDWDDAVLEFHRSKSVVRTASVAQTRQPIYKTSRNRWVNYAHHLEPLIAEIAPYLQDDREQLEELGIQLPAGPGLLKRLFN